MRYFLISWMMFSLISCSMLNINNSNNAPIVTLTGIGFGEVGLFSQTYRLDLLLENPNPVPLPIAGMTYNLNLNGKAFARGTNNYQGMLEAFGKQKISVELTSNVAGLFDQLRGLQRDGVTGFSYDLSGQVYLSNGMSPLSFNSQDKVNLDTHLNLDKF